MGTAPIMDEAEEDVLYDDLLKERVNHAIFLAASELDDTTLVERSMERLEIAQRAHVQAMLECHEDDRFALRVEVEDALGGLKDAQRFFLTFATEVEDIANEVRLAHVPLPPFPHIEAPGFARETLIVSTLLHALDLSARRAFGGGRGGPPARGRPCDWRGGAAPQRERENGTCHERGHREGLLERR